jgi:hypothetical protein
MWIRANRPGTGDHDLVSANGEKDWRNLDKKFLKNTNL